MPAGLRYAPATSSTARSTSCLPTTSPRRWRSRSSRRWASGRCSIPTGSRSSSITTSRTKTSPRRSSARSPAISSQRIICPISTMSVVRGSLTSMAVEAGAKNGIMEPDDLVLEWIRPRARRPLTVYRSDADARYVDVREYDVSTLEPVVSVPASPGNVVPVREAAGVRVDQCFIGTCTNGRIEDMRLAAKVLAGRTVHPHTRLLVIPATPAIYRQAMDEGLVQIFLDAAAAISTSTSGPCIRGHMGVLADGEVCVSTSSRNFVGRIGQRGSKVYLSNAAVAAAAAVAGKLVHPDEVVLATCPS